MTDKRMTNKRKEPVKKLRVWIGFTVLFVLINPWYFPTGSYSPLIAGIPYWALIILAASLALSLFITYVALCEWQIEEFDEQREREE